MGSQLGGLWVSADLCFSTASALDKLSAYMTPQLELFEPLGAATIADHEFTAVETYLRSSQYPKELACCSVSDPHAVSWLSVVFSIGLGLHLEPNEYQMVIRWWLARAVYCKGDEKGGLGTTTAKAQGCQ
eukprot:Em0027g46a